MGTGRTDTRAKIVLAAILAGIVAIIAFAIANPNGVKKDTHVDRAYEYLTGSSEKYSSGVYEDTGNEKSDMKLDTSTPSSSTTTTTPKAPETTVSQKNALRRAKSYLNSNSFSHDGLVEQLEYEGFSNEDATYGADNCGANWMRQAEAKAKSYNDLFGYSRSGLIDQLLYEGFTEEEAEHGADSVGL